MGNYPGVRCLKAGEEELLLAEAEEVLQVIALPVSLLDLIQA